MRMSLATTSDVKVLSGRLTPNGVQRCSRSDCISSGVSGRNVDNQPCRRPVPIHLRAVGRYHYSRGKMIMTIFAGIAEFERNLIRERTGAGRVDAQKRGVRFGRPRR